MSKKNSKNNKDITLVVVESPSKAKTINKYLGDSYIVRASFGHIMDLSTSGKNHLGIDIENGFKPKYTILPDKKDKIDAIIDAASTASEILLASDPDREGEAISWHLAECLQSTGKPMKRVELREITKAGVLKAISNPRELDKNLYDAQQARRVLDRIVGFMVSPYLINSIGPNLSAGRVQSVAVRLIVDREKEILNFKPEEYWNISAQLAKNENEESFSAKYTGKVTDKATADKIKKDLESSNFIVSKVDAKDKNRNPNPPFTTAKLQQAAGARYKFNTEKTMRLAQSLYENGYITYIRTDSIRSSPESIDAARKWLSDNKYDVPDKPVTFKNKDTAQDAHEAIRPTNIYLTPEKFYGSDDEKKLYQLIWERFIASQMMPAVYSTVSITINTSTGHELKANGRTLKYAGWLAITGEFESEEDNSDDVKLPLLKNKDKLILVPPKVKAEKKQTQPPPRYSEVSLNKELERRGIGRPSTLATIFNKITERSYVEKKKNGTYVPTELGMKVVDTLVKYFEFMDYKYTADMEDKLDQIADGKLNYIDMMNSFFIPFKSHLKAAYKSNYRKVGHYCGNCNEEMILKHNKYGYFICCPDYPECKFSKSVELDGDNIVIKDNNKGNIVDGVQCPKCNSGMFKRDGKYGPFYACSAYPKCNGSRKIPFGMKCNKCGDGELYLTVFKDEPKLACMEYPACKNIVDVPKNAKLDWVVPSTIQPSKEAEKKAKRILK